MPEECPTIFDQILLVDSSRSISEALYEEKVKPLLTEWTSYWDVGAQLIRQGGIVFSTGAARAYGLSQLGIQTQALLQQEHEDLPYFGELSNFSRAIDGASLMIYNEGRPDIARNVTLFVDGGPNTQVGRLRDAVKRLLSFHRVCLAVVGMNVPENSDSEWFLKKLLGCEPNGGDCPLYARVDLDDALQTSTALVELQANVCDCVTNTVQPPIDDVLTCVTIKLQDTTLDSLGDPNEVRRVLRRTIFDVAEELAISPRRVSAVDITDTTPDSVADVVAGFGGGARRLQAVGDGAGSSGRSSHGFVELTVSEASEHEPNELNAKDVGSQLLQHLNNPDSQLSRRLKAVLPSESISVHRVQTRSKKDRRVIDVLHQA